MHEMIPKPLLQRSTQSWTWKVIATQKQIKNLVCDLHAAIVPGAYHCVKPYQNHFSNIPNQCV